MTAKIPTVPFKDVAAYCKAAKISLKDVTDRLGLTEGAARYWRRSGRVPKHHLDNLQLIPEQLPTEEFLKDIHHMSSPSKPDPVRGILPKKNGWRLSDPNEMFHFMAAELRNGGQWKILLVRRDDKDPDLITTVKVY